LNISIDTYATVAIMTHNGLYFPEI